VTLFLQLAYTFFKIGLLTVGGGLAMLPLVQHEMVQRGWMTQQQFLDILGVAEMTPGPMAVNTATFVGYRVVDAAYPHPFWLSVAGALLCTLAICMPSLLFVNLLGGFWQRHRSHPCLVRVFDILRPLVTGLVATAALLLVGACLWGEGCGRAHLASPDLRAAALVAAAFGMAAFTKVSPVVILAGGVAAGLLLGLLPV
jgi:chromate transporter